MEHLERLSKDGDPVGVIEATVDFEHFRGWLVEVIGYGDGSKGGRHSTRCRCSRLTERGTLNG